MTEHNRRATDDKIFEMHGTLSALSESMRQLREDMATVPMNSANIERLKAKVEKLEAEMTKVQKEQKIIEMASIFFRVFKWLAGLIIAIGGAWAVLESLNK